MRDHRKLEVFQMIHELVLRTYQHTRAFPRDEAFGLTSQMRRSAVSAAANIVEGAARRSSRDYNRFLEISFSSLRELGYYIDLAVELEYLDPDKATSLKDLQNTAAAKLGALLKQRRGV